MFRKVYKITITQLDSQPPVQFIYFALTTSAWRAIKEAEAFAQVKSVETKKQWGITDALRIK